MSTSTTPRLRLPARTRLVDRTAPHTAAAVTTDGVQADGSILEQLAGGLSGVLNPPTGTVATWPPFPFPTTPTGPLPLPVPIPGTPLPLPFGNLFNNLPFDLPLIRL